MGCVSYYLSRFANLFQYARKELVYMPFEIGVRQLRKLQWSCNYSVVTEQQVFPLISSYTNLPQTYSWTYRSWSCRSTVRIAVNSRTEWSTAWDGRAERTVAEIRVDIHSKNHESSVLWTVDNGQMDSPQVNFIHLEVKWICEEIIYFSLRI